MDLSRPACDISFMDFKIDRYPEDADEFELFSAAICKAWRRHAGGKSKIAALERTIYELVEHLIAHDVLDDALERRKTKLSRRGAPGRPNPFRSVLRAVFDGERQGPTDDQRSRMSRRLLSAYWHFIPPEFLTGFLHDLGHNPKNNAIQPRYENWLVSQLRKKRNQHLLKDYPKEIRKMVRQNLTKEKPRAWRQIS